MNSLQGLESEISWDLFLYIFLGKKETISKNYSYMYIHMVTLTDKHLHWNILSKKFLFYVASSSSYMYM